MNAKDRRAFAAKVQEFYRNKSMSFVIRGRRRRVVLDFSNEVSLDDGNGRTIPRREWSPLQKHFLKDACAFRWEIDGKSGITSISHTLLKYAVGGDKSARRFIRSAIERSIREKVKA